jgi:hypothetical protein
MVSFTKVAKYSSNRTFLEDVGLKPEDAFRTDSKANRQYIKFTSLPFAETAHYKAKWKREILTEKNQIFERNEKRRSELVRFFSKDFQKSFLNPGT